VFVVRMYMGPPDIRSTNSTRTYAPMYQTYATFWNTFLLIIRHMLHPFTHFVNSTGRTLGFGGHLLLFRELAVALAYKIPFVLTHSPTPFQTFGAPLGCQNHVRFCF
jgi:hypothetical protein